MGRTRWRREDLAAPDQEYPLLTWSSQLRNLQKKRDSDQYDVTIDEDLTVRTNPKIGFRQRRFEVWGPRGLDVDDQGGKPGSG